MMKNLTPYQNKALDYKHHISLTANAGSGKTFVLSKRFVEIALNEDVRLKNIVAITFTEKAAGELNKKIAGEVDERLKSETDKKIVRKLESIRRQLVSANISTIHSFCIEILKEFSPEAGIDANFVPIDSETSNELIDLTIEEAFNSLTGNDEFSEQLKYLIRFFASKIILAQQFNSTVQNRSSFQKVKEKIYSQSDDYILQYFRNTYNKYLENILIGRLPGFINAIEKVNKIVLHLNPENNYAVEIEFILSEIPKENNLQNIMTLLTRLNEEILTSSGTVKKRRYLTGEERESVTAEIVEIENFLTDFRMLAYGNNAFETEKELLKFGRIFLSVTDKIIEGYSAKKNEKGYLDFEDLLLFTLKIIKRAEVQKYLCDKYKYIMIDEYQDTNEIQYEIFMPILDDLKAGNLFVVGDEKQSIYMFRDADLKVFSTTQKEISKMQSNESLLNLPHSFRVVPQIALFANVLFKEILKDPQPDFNEVNYSELICAKDEKDKGNVEILLSNIISEDKSESELIARRILKLIKDDPDVNFKDIAILCRKRSVFSDLEKSFIKYKIPYSIIGGKGFYQRQIIYDIYNYLQFLLNEKNDAPLVGILRSPFFTLPDSEILEISLCEGDTFFQKLKQYSKDNNRYKNVVKTLEEDLIIAPKIEITKLLRKILSQTGYWSVIASKTNSSQELANLEKVLTVAGKYSGRSFKTLYDFVNYLQEAIDTLEDESQAAVAKDEESVKLMTIHQAKGLEYRAVFIYGCNDGILEDKVKSKSVSVDKNFGILTKVPVNNNYFEEYESAPIVNLYNFIIQKKNLAEAKRVLYVAATRAMNYLFFTVSHKDGKISKNSFFDMLTGGLRFNLEEEVVEIRDRLKFMKGSEENYEVYEKELSLKIPLIKELKNIKPYSGQRTMEETSEININISEIDDHPKNEIISATKLAIYSQCPVKYQLTYDLGYKFLQKLFQKYTGDYEFHYKEDEETAGYADVKGRVIHKILEREIAKEDLRKNIENYLSKETAGEIIYESNKDKLEEKIVSYLENFYKSNIYKEINSFNNFKNEFEIYSKYKDYFLYGIIDKLIIEKDKLIVIDYKTDDISVEQISERGNAYMTQLKFYCFILTKLFENIDKFEVKIIFIKYPDEIFSKNISRDDFKNYGKYLDSFVKATRYNEFQPDLSHCEKCHFSLDDNKCVKLSDTEN